MGNAKCDFDLLNVPLHVKKQCTERFQSSCLFSRQTHFCNLGKQNFQQGQSECAPHKTQTLGSKFVYDCCVACKIGSGVADRRKNCDQLQSNYNLTDQTKHACCLFTLQKHIKCRFVIYTYL